MAGEPGEAKPYQLYFELDVKLRSSLYDVDLISGGRLLMEGGTGSDKGLALSLVEPLVQPHTFFWVKVIFKSPMVRYYDVLTLPEAKQESKVAVKETSKKFASDIRRRPRGEEIFQIGIAPGGTNAHAAHLMFEGADQLRDVQIYLAVGDSMVTVEDGVQYEVATSPDGVVYKSLFVTSNPRFVRTVPAAFMVAAPFPNPFHPNVTLQYSLPYRWDSNGWLNEAPYVVSVTILDSRGRVVRSLVHKKQRPGTYSSVWNGKSGTGRIVGAGTYFFSIKAGKYEESRPMVLVK